MRIVTEQHSDGWIAYPEGMPTLWESGESEAEAIGKLVLTFQVAWKDTYRVSVDFI
jgi:hypothetical protein